jgi:hypothetical protein
MKTSKRVQANIITTPKEILSKNDQALSEMQEALSELEWVKFKIVGLLDALNVIGEYSWDGSLLTKDGTQGLAILSQGVCTELDEKYNKVFSAFRSLKTASSLKK